MDEWKESAAPLNPEQPELGGAETEEQPKPKLRSGAQVRQESAPGRDLYLNVRLLVVVMTIFVLIFTFVARVIVVSGPSMKDTLQNEDVMLVWSLGYTPKQGDVVVLTQRSYQEDSIVKRVIATGGQTVDIDYDTNTVYVDGEALTEDYIREPMRIPGYGEGLNHVTVPDGCIFVMGDNRNESADSRYPYIGIVDVRCVIGQAKMVLYPFGHWKFL